MTRQVAVIPRRDPTLKWPWQVRITTRDTDGTLIAVRFLRARTQEDAHTIAKEHQPA